ncbi:MAG: phenylalanine--tRNA ligase subunit alpha [Candidatus Aenigmarchaeota archaeon]|nr:phenylalanine--tRNA ligase subunit alpha [Candidatus Aenigmarchaeota archaeon]
MNLNDGDLMGGIYHPHETVLLKCIYRLKEQKGSAALDVKTLSKESGLNEDSVRKAALWLSNKGLVKVIVEEEKTDSLTNEGIKYSKTGLPESELYRLIAIKGPAEIRNLKGREIAIMWAKKKGWIKISNGVVELLSHPKDPYEDKHLLNDVVAGSKIPKEKLEEFKNRNLVLEKSVKKESVAITGKGSSEAELFLKAGFGPDAEIGKLTPETIKSGQWKKGLRSYDVTLSAGRLIAGKKHITTIWADKIRKIFLDMGFREASGPLVESSFWCFDALYQPQDHPSRELADTFYMKKPARSELPNAPLVNAVKTAHEKGVDGSTGWMYKWSGDIAKKPVLRTHTTAVSARSLQGLTAPAKIFCIGRAFRNETVDYKHLPEFTQVEGIVADENVTFRDLLGYLKEFYSRLGFDKIRFRPAYFPYTEMSVEPEVYFEEKKEWVELGGAGILRPEVTNPLGVDVPVLAWGLSLERPIALMTGLNDIRNFYFKNDLKLLRDTKVNV